MGFQLLLRGIRNRYGVLDHLGVLQGAGGRDGLPGTRLVR